MRRRLLFGGDFNIEENASADVGDVVVLDNNTGELYLCNYTMYASTPEYISAVGLVVVPSSHSMYYDNSTISSGACGIMALVNASRSHPIIGATTSEMYDEDLEWGYSDAKYDGLEFNDRLPSNGTIGTGITDMNTLGIYGELGYLSSDKVYLDSSIPNSSKTTDTSVLHRFAYYTNNSSDYVLISNPYAYYGGSNFKYTDTYPNKTPNAFTPFDGKETADILCNASSDKSWQTSNTIPAFNNVIGNHPAAWACWRLQTGLLSWYLPSLGELGYMYTRSNQLDNILKSVEEAGKGNRVCRIYYYDNNNVCHSGIYLASNPNIFSPVGIFPNLLDFGSHGLIQPIYQTDTKYLVRPFAHKKITKRITI